MEFSTEHPKCRSFPYTSSWISFEVDLVLVPSHRFLASQPLRLLSFSLSLRLCSSCSDFPYRVSWSMKKEEKTHFDLMHSRAQANEVPPCLVFFKSLFSNLIVCAYLFVAWLSLCFPMRWCDGPLSRIAPWCCPDSEFWVSLTLMLYYCRAVHQFKAVHYGAFCTYGYFQIFFSFVSAPLPTHFLSAASSLHGCFEYRPALPFLQNPLVLWCDEATYTSLPSKTCFLFSIKSSMFLSDYNNAATM